MKRVFDDSTAVNTTSERYPLSDHYGVWVTYSAKDPGATAIPEGIVVSLCGTEVDIITL